MQILLGRDRYPGIPLSTKKGTNVPNEQRLEQTPESLRAAVDVCVGACPGIEPRSASSTYNCIGLVFASRRTWVDPEYVPLLLAEDGYYRVDIASAKLGDVVVYRNFAREITHAGIIVEKRPVLETAEWDVRVLSQWGASGEYVHRLSDVPSLLGSPAEFWSERKNVT